MAKAIKEINLKVSLKVAWGARDKLRAEGDKLRAEGVKLWAEGDKLRAEGVKLWAEGDKLSAEGDKLWAEKTLAVVGNVTMEWTYRTDKNDYACTVDGRETFEPKKRRA